MYEENSLNSVGSRYSALFRAAHNVELLTAIFQRRVREVYPDVHFDAGKPKLK